jgi:hypothetical protein
VVLFLSNAIAMDWASKAPMTMVIFFRHQPRSRLKRRSVLSLTVGNSFIDNLTKLIIVILKWASTVL